MHPTGNPNPYSPIRAFRRFSLPCAILCLQGSFEVLGTLATSLTIGLGRASIQAVRQHGLGVQDVQHLILSDTLAHAGQLIRHSMQTPSFAT